MGRNRYAGYLEETQRGYLAAFDMYWNLLEARRIDPAAGAAQSLAAFIREYETQGWTAECAAPFGFTFMRRAGVRILVEATPRDPNDETAQSFSPFKGSP